MITRKIKIRFREVYDNNPTINNLSLKIKVTRVFIRYLTFNESTSKDDESRAFV